MTSITVDRLASLIQSKLNNNIADVEYTGPKELEGTRHFTFSRGKLGWSAYRGSETIVRNTSLRYCCISVCDYVDLV